MTRITALTWAPPAGLVAGALLYLTFGGHGGSARLDALNTQLAGLSAAPTSIRPREDGRNALTSPIFSLTTGPGAVSEVAVVLKGLAITPSARAALVSINGKPAQWLRGGESRDGVTVTDIQAGKVTVDTLTGIKDLGLWEGDPAPAATGPGAAPMAGAGPQSGATAQSEAPPMAAPRFPHSPPPSVQR